MIGDRLNMPRNTVNERTQTELVDLLESARSRLKFKNPADLDGDDVTPIPELQAWSKQCSVVTN